MIILTMYCTSRWLDGKSNLILEIGRIGIFMIIGMLMFLIDLNLPHLWLGSYIYY